MTLPVMLESWANISPCEKYRYNLGRIWDRDKPLLGIIGLNCSTADAKKNDPTVTREILFAIRDGFGGLIKGNLFAFRATNPVEMLAQGFDAIGPENDEALKTIAALTRKLVVAWGAHGGFLDQDLEVCELLAGTEFFCFGTTKDGHPKHPLYLKKTTKLVPWAPRQEN